MSKHTPGPWKIEIRGGDEWYFSGMEFVVRSPPDARGWTYPIAVYAADSDEEKANAHLIAAAPELLEAIRYVIRYSDRISPGDIHRMGELISKAEGRT